MLKDREKLKPKELNTRALFFLATLQLMSQGLFAQRCQAHEVEQTFLDHRLELRPYFEAFNHPLGHAFIPRDLLLQLLNRYLTAEAKVLSKEVIDVMYDDTLLDLFFGFNSEQSDPNSTESTSSSPASLHRNQSSFKIDISDAIKRANRASLCLLSDVIEASISQITEDEKTTWQLRKIYSQFKNDHHDRLLAEAARIVTLRGEDPGRFLVLERFPRKYIPDDFFH